MSISETVGAVDLHGVDLASIASSAPGQIKIVKDVSWGFAQDLFASASSQLVNSRLFQYQQQRSTKQPFRKLRRIARHSLKELYGSATEMSPEPQSVRRKVVPELKPRGPGCNDTTIRERLVNVATSLPFLALSHHELRQEGSQNRKAYGISMLAVGLAATAYHCSSGSIRKAFRRADHWTISMASNQLARAVHPGKVPIFTTALTLAATPFQPTAVTTLNMAAAEMGLASAARHDPSRRRAYRHHVLAGATGLACFGLEDKAIKHDFHFVHSLWHCLAFYGLTQASSVMS